MNGKQKNKKSIGFDPQKDPSRRLAVAYVVALLAIAGFSIGSHYFSLRVAVAQKEMTEISYLAGRQRMLAQQTALYALRYNALHQEEDRLGVEKNTADFERGHKHIALFSIQQGQSGRFKSQVLYDIYFKPPFDLDIKAGLYVKKARDFISYGQEEPVFQRDAALEYVFKQSIGPLLSLLDQAAVSYQKEAAAEMRQLEDIQMQALYLVIAVLVLEALLIFWPLVSHVRTYSRRLMELALYDYLTGMNNRWAYMERVAGELSRAERHKRSFCLAMADIDGFKIINDTYGHEAGDMVLRHFADVLKFGLRAEDIFGRVGGEEFSIFLPETPAAGGRQALERLRKIVEKSACDIGRGRTLNYTVSFGMVGNDNVVLVTAEELMRAADEALYKAKQSGRNRVELAPQPRDPDTEAEGESGQALS